MADTAKPKAVDILDRVLAWPFQWIRSPLDQYDASARLQRLARRPAQDLRSALQQGERRRNKNLAAILLILSGLAVAVVQLFPYVAGLSEVTAVVMFIIALVSIYALEFFLLRRNDGLLAQELAVLRMSRLIGFLETNEDRWREPSFMAEVCLRIERVAAMVQSVPKSFKLRDAVTRLEFATSMLARAQNLRRCQLWVVSPDVATRDQLLDHLEKLLVFMLDSRWLELPGVDVTLAPAGRVVRGTRWVLVSIGLGTVVAVQLLTPQLGPAAPSISAIAGILAVAALSGFGVTADQIKAGTSLGGT